MKLLGEDGVQERIGTRIQREYEDGEDLGQPEVLDDGGAVHCSQGEDTDRKPAGEVGEDK